MSKRTKEPLQSQLNVNTLDHYFKYAEPHGKPLAKFADSDPRDQFTINGSTNCSYQHAETVQNYDHDDDNSCQNAINFNQLKHMKNPQIEVELNREEDTTRAIPPQKMIVPNHDDSPTRNFRQKVHDAFKEKIKNENPQQNTTKKVKASSVQVSISNLSCQINTDKAVENTIAENHKKVEQILRKEPLRVRYSQLLSQDLNYSIGYQHVKLIKLLQTVDNTISYLKMNRSSKSVFYSDVRNSLEQYCKGMQFTHRHLQQLIFLDETLYELDWAINDKFRRHDLQIRLPQIKSHDARRREVRKKIVAYLLAKEAEFLAEKKIDKLNVSNWNEGFDPNQYEIPTKSLPTHPNAKNAEIKELSNSQIEAVPNPHLRTFMKGVKQDSDAQSLRSEHVVKKIFNGDPNITDMLYRAIKEKQQRNAAILENEKNHHIEKQVLLAVCYETMMAYMAKKVTNIFQQTLIDILNKKLRYKQPQLIQALKIIVDSKQIGFLKEITTSNKALVLQINRLKFDQMREKLQKMA